MKDTPSFWQYLFGGHIHDWGPWETYKSGGVWANEKSKNPVGWYITQKRECLGCHKIELQQVEG